MSIRIGIAGYGNLGKGAELAVRANADMELVAIFSRRAGKQGVQGSVSVPLCSIEDAADMVNDIDVMLLCGGSASDLPEQGPYFASMFNTVDSYDTHAKIPGYLASVDAAAKNTTAIISTGWDPGLFSMMRVLFGAALSEGKTYTFWGKGLSQGHSDAVRRIDGVKHAAQYTIPNEEAISTVRSGQNPVFTARDKHMRECFVVVEPGSEKAKIENAIKNMPNYFADFNTTVNFIDEAEFMANHSEMPHGGVVLHSGKTGTNNQAMEFSLKLDSNPEFTGSVLAAYARAAFRMSQEGLYGAKTVFDIPLGYLHEKDRASLIKELL